MPASHAKHAKRRIACAGGALGPWIVFPWIALAPLTTGGCVGPVDAGGGEPTGTTSSAIYGGVIDDDAQQNASVVAIEVGPPGATSFTLCSGALLAPNVVLTARHCVSVESNTAPTCDQNGNDTSGADLGDDVPLANIRVMVGPAIYQTETPAAGATAIFHSSGSTQCNADLALIQLDKPITTVAPMRVRVQSGVTVGETVRAVGFGYNDQDASVGTRFRKDGVSVLAVGSTVSASQTALGSNEFEVGESMCGGDSGGPAIDEKTGAIVGIVARGPADCTLASGHVYTALQGFLTVFQQAFASAGGSWVDESAPQPTVDAGGGGPAPSPDAGGTTSSSGGNGETGGTGRPPQYGGVNLESGKGDSCSAGPAPSGGVDLAALAGLGLVALAIARRRVL